MYRRRRLRSRFRVQGSGCRVQGSGFRVQGSGFRAQGSGLRVQGYRRSLLLRHLHLHRIINLVAFTATKFTTHMLFYYQARRSHCPST